MKTTTALWTIGLLAGLAACHSTDQSGRPRAEADEKKERPSVVYFRPDGASLTSNFDTWYRYTYRTIHLAQPFTGLDETAKTVDKGVFLTHLLTGRFVPLNTERRGALPVYRLYRVDQPSPDIVSTIREMARNELANHKLEGTPLPAFAFTDLTGKKYTTATSRGKTLILKGWFIHCVACVAEFPELNRLVDAHQARNDIQFVSLALDSRPQLISFLQRKPLRYAVVPDAETYLAGKLGITRYPTHIVVDKQGRIVKVVNSVRDLLTFLTSGAGS